MGGVRRVHGGGAGPRDTAKCRRLAAQVGAKLQIGRFLERWLDQFDEFEDIERAAR